MTNWELNLARWFADKIASEAKLPKYVQKEVGGMGFDPSTGALTVTLKHPVEPRQVRFRFVPEVVE